TMAQDINAQLTTWFSQRLAGFSDEVVGHAPFIAQSATELRTASLQHDGQREAVGQRQCGGALRQ
ncbi:flagellar basal body P-ring biosynthesis protein FlgA, partial [Salmonella enterica subsp. enterica serovar Enteritidis str. 76-2651]